MIRSDDLPYCIVDSRPFNRPLKTNALSSRLTAPRAWHFLYAWKNNSKFQNIKIDGWRKESGISKQQRGKNLNKAAGFPLTVMRASTSVGAVKGVDTSPMISTTKRWKSPAIFTHDNAALVHVMNLKLFIEPYTPDVPNLKINAIHN
jgi:hypothetical protein